MAFGTPTIDPETNGNPLLEWSKQNGQIHPALIPVIQKVMGSAGPAGPTPTLAPPQAQPPPLSAPSANDPAPSALASNGTATSHPAAVPASTTPGTNGSPATGAPAPSGTPVAVPASASAGPRGISQNNPSTALSAAPNTPAKAEYDRLVKTGSGESQIKNPWARVPLQVLDAIGSAFFPSLTMGIPGTQLHHDVLVNQARRGVTEEADVREKEARAEHERAEASNAKTTAQAPHTLQTAEGIMQWNPDTKRFDIPAGQPPVKEEEEGRTVTTDQGVMQWDPKTKTYGIKVGNAPEKEGAEKTLQDADGAWYHIGKDNTATPITINGQPFKGKAAGGQEGELPLRDRVPQLNKMLTDRYQVLHAGKPLPAEYQIPANATQKDYDRIDKALEGEERAGATAAQQQQLNEMRRQTQTLAGKKEELSVKQAALKAYTPALDSAERFNVMTKNYEDAVRSNDQQAMLSLLANHIGMTMGLQKGARINQAMYNEAQRSVPFLQGVAAKFDKDGYLSGVTLTPSQMRQMVNLGRERFSEDVTKGRNESRYLGTTDEGPERTPSKATINHYLGLANGDAAKAKQLAAADGWTVK